METSEYGGSADRGPGDKREAQRRGGERGRPPLVDALVRPRCVEVGPVLREDTPEMSLAQHEDVIEALPAQRAETALRECVRLWGEDGGADDANARCLGGRVEGSSPRSCVVETNGEAPRLLHAAVTTVACFSFKRDMSR